MHLRTDGGSFFSHFFFFFLLAVTFCGRAVITFFFLDGCCWAVTGLCVCGEKFRGGQLGRDTDGDWGDCGLGRGWDRLGSTFCFFCVFFSRSLFSLPFAACFNWPVSFFSATVVVGVQWCFVLLRCWAGTGLGLVAYFLSFLFLLCTWVLVRGLFFGAQIVVFFIFYFIFAVRSKPNQKIHDTVQSLAVSLLPCCRKKSRIERQDTNGWHWRVYEGRGEEGRDPAPSGVHIVDCSGNREGAVRDEYVNSWSRQCGCPLSYIHYNMPGRAR
ncbi:hypothetical protein EDC01DRAFT_89650 [Geopyxis carbonaria]|nr:hypothetical protein EDC01DRAFT_89650 [Geopyxis carbonaria]